MGVHSRAIAFSTDSSACCSLTVCCSAVILALQLKARIVGLDTTVYGLAASFNQS